MLAREVARRVEGVDYRALAAASMLGLGSIWAQGLSGSAALQMATPGALQPQIRDIVAAGGLVPDGMIPFTDTIFLWQSLVSVFVEIVVVVGVMWLATPPASKAKTAAVLGIELGNEERVSDPGPPPPPGQRRSRTRDNIPPGAWLEHSPLLSLLIVAMGTLFLVRYVGARRRSAERAHRQHHQPFVPDARHPAPQDAGAIDAGRPSRRRRPCGA